MKAVWADEAIYVSQFGISTKTAVPPGLGPYSLGDITPSAYVDRYRRLRWPTRAEMVAQFRNSAFICSSINANGVVNTPLKLYVETRTGEPRPKCRVKGLSKRQQAWVRGEQAGRVKSSSSMTGRIAGDSDVEEVPSHPALGLLAKPNPYHSGPDVQKLLINYLDIVGTGYWFTGERTRLGTPKTIYPIPSHLLYPWRDTPTSKELISYWLFTSGRMQVKLKVEDVIDFKLTDLWEPYTRGMAPNVGVWEHITINEQMLAHTGNMLDNQGRPDALLTPDNMIGEYERQRLEQRYNSKFRAGGFGAILVTEESMKLQPLTWPPTDLAALQIHQETLEMVCHAFGVPLALITKDTNLANLEAARSQHAELGIWPRLINRDETLNRLLIPLYDDSGRLFFCSDNPVPEDEDMALKKRVAAVQGGWQTRHEARTEDGMEEAEWAKKPTLPSTQQVLDESGKPIPPPTPPGMGPNGKPGQGSSGRAGGAGKDKKKKKKKKQKASQRIDDLLRLSEAVTGGRMGLALAREMVSKCYGEDAAILFEEGLRDAQTRGPHGRSNGVERNRENGTGIDIRLRPVGSPPLRAPEAQEKDVDLADPMARRALDRLEHLPRLSPNDPEDRVPVPFRLDLDASYGIGTVLSEEEWVRQPVGQFYLRELCATQSGVKRAKVREFIISPDVTPQAERGESSVPGKSVPRIVRYAEDPANEKSELYIDNGHHHLTALWLLGRQEVSARYLDLTAGREAVLTVTPDPASEPASTMPEETLP